MSLASFSGWMDVNCCISEVSLAHLQKWGQIPGTFGVKPSPPAACASTEAEKTLEFRSPQHSADMVPRKSKDQPAWQKKRRLPNRRRPTRIKKLVGGTSFQPGVELQKRELKWPKDDKFLSALNRYFWAWKGWLVWWPTNSTVQQS